MPVLDFFTTLWLASMVCGLFALGGLLIAPTLRGAMPSVSRLTIANVAMFAGLVSRILAGVQVDNLAYALFWTLWLASNAAMVSALRHGIGLDNGDRQLSLLVVAGAVVLHVTALAFASPQPTAIAACLWMAAISIIGARVTWQVKPEFLSRAKVCIGLAFVSGVVGALAHLPMRVGDLLAGRTLISQTPSTYVLLLSVWLALNIGMMLLLYLRLVERVGDLAHLDELTGLLNRRGLSVKMRERRREFGSVVQGAIVMIDIDHFKHVNDTYGHASGDDVLRWFSENLRRFMRHGDLLVRLGGEEFSLIMPACPVNDAKAVAERIRDEFDSRATVICQGVSLRITASFGVAQLGGDGAHLDQDLQRADEALYCAKRAGRNRVQTWSAAIVGAVHPYGASASANLAV